MRSLTLRPISENATTDFDATAKYVVGEIRYENHRTYGARYWRYVKNTQLVAATKGFPAVTDTKAGYDDCVAPSKAIKHKVAGVWQGACPASYYGWVLADGYGYVKDSGAGITGDLQFVGDAGGVIQYNAGGGDTVDLILGRARADIGAAALALAEIRCL